MKLPPKPECDMAVTIPQPFMVRSEKALDAWGRACAEAALKQAAKECDAIWERDHAAGFAGAGSSAACIKAIRNIKIEDSK